VTKKSKISKFLGPGPFQASKIMLPIVSRPQKPPGGHFEDICLVRTFASIHRQNLYIGFAHFGSHGCNSPYSGPKTSKKFFCALNMWLHHSEVVPGLPTAIGHSRHVAVLYHFPYVRVDERFWTIIATTRPLHGPLVRRTSGMRASCWGSPSSDMCLVHKHWWVLYSATSGERQSMHWSLGRH